MQALTAQQAYAQQVQQNLAARQAVLTMGVKRTQQIGSQVSTAATGTNILNFVPQNVGLIQGFLIEVDGNIINSGGGTLTRTEFGVANAIQNITFSDLSNYIRHNTTGWHLSAINGAKQGFVWGAAFQPNVPQDWTAFNTSFANTNLVVPNWNVRSAPLSILTTTNANIREFYYLPLAYSASDLRGAIYGGVTNATMNLQITLNLTPVTAAGDQTNAIYTGTTGGWNGNVTVTVYQIYYDQLPTAQGANGASVVVLPYMDMNQQYCLLMTAIGQPIAASDFPYAYANYRSFLSTCLVYDNNGVLNAGSDVNYFSLTSANNTNIFKYTPQVAALLARQVFMADPPKGFYYFDTRQSPINTNQFGNMVLNINASAVTAGANVFVGVEYFAQQQAVAGAQSLAA